MPGTDDIGTHRGEYDLFNLPPDPADEAEAPLSPTEAFERFHANNPHFYACLVQLARRFIARTGRSVVGMQRLIEVARYDVEIATESADEFKVDNNHASYYSRLIMWQEPDLAGAIPIRSSPDADAWIAVLKHGRAAA